MANYNPHNFNLGQFMNDLYQLLDLHAQFKFLGDQFEVINSYSLMLEKELQKVSTLVTIYKPHQHQELWVHHRPVGPPRK